MRRRVYRSIGLVVVLAAISGLLVSLAGIAGVWRVMRSMKTGLATTLDLAGTTLQTTSEAMAIAGGALDQADDSLSALVDTLQTAGQSLHDTIPLVDTLALVATEDVPETVLATQAALESAQVSAGVVDATLAVLTSIPLLPVERYEPGMSLSQALADVSASLDPISESLSSLQTPLADTRANLAAFEAQFAAVAGDVEQISLSLAEARGITEQYQQVITALQRQLDLARASLPRQLDRVAWFLTILLAWLSIAQLGLMMQGFEMLGLDFTRPRERPPEPAAAEPPPDHPPASRKE